MRRALNSIRLLTLSGCGVFGVMSNTDSGAAAIAAAVMIGFTAPLWFAVWRDPETDRGGSDAE